MDGPKEGEDFSYQSQPNMCDLSSSPSECTSESSSLSEASHASPSLSALNLSKKDACNQDKTKNLVKKCPCKESVQWSWDNNSKSESVYLVNDNMDVKFHKRCSRGTGIVRCTEPMANNQYYWEVQLTYPVYGTDLMIGVGTSEAEIKDMPFHVSLLGRNNKTWGLSYTGLFHHNGQRRLYAKSFGQGSIIGVHLDLWKGTLSFYKDRKHLGVASTGLQGKTLYAMASSTAADTGMRMILSCSFPSSLQFLCCSKLRELIPDDKNVLDVIDVPSTLKQFLESKLSWLLSKRCLERDLPICCPIVETESDDEDTTDESLVLNPFNIGGQFILLTSVLMSNWKRQLQGLRCQNQERGESSGRQVKRRRCSSDKEND